MGLSDCPKWVYGIGCACGALLGFTLLGYLDFTVRFFASVAIGMAVGWIFDFMGRTRS